MEKVKQQHYVPRMYLNRFGYISHGAKKITVLKLDDGIVLENQRTENFASVNYFYDTEKKELMEALCDDFILKPELINDEKLSDKQFVEHALAREESAISKMLDELQKDFSKVHVSPNKSLMIIFLHSLAYRTKYYRDQMDDINNKTQELLNVVCDSLDLDESIRKKTIEENCATGKESQL